MPGHPDYEALKPLIGNYKTKNSIPVKSLLENNATVTLSSDWDVSTNNPFVGMANALHRNPQSVTLKVDCFCVYANC
jgi:predicted amidohydrolase YtcJ